jgi:hypothetical protein
MNGSETELAIIQRNQFAYYVVRIAVALNLVDGKEAYTGDQVAFLAESALKMICDSNVRANPAFAAERQALLDGMPQLRPLLTDE